MKSKNHVGLAGTKNTHDKNQQKKPIDSNHSNFPEAQVIFLFQ